MIDEIIKEMGKINYGYKDKYNKIHEGVDEMFALNYVLETPDEVINNKIGVCWDQVELERMLFEKYKIKFNTYFIVHYDNDKCPTHTFLIYEENNHYYWFENSWEIFRGIHKYNSLNDALIDIKNKFIKYELNNNYNSMNLCIYKYDKPNYGISCIDFYKHCEKGKNIIL